MDRIRSIVGILLITAMVVLAISAVTGIYGLRDATLPVRIPREDINWSIQQVEVESFKLYQEALHLNYTSLPVSRLALRYEVLLSRTDLFKVGEFRSEVAKLPKARKRVDAITFRVESLRYLVDGAVRRDQSSLEQLLVELAELQKQAHELTLVANQEIIALQVDIRKELAETFLKTEVLLSVLALTVIIGLLSLIAMVIRAEKATTEAQYHRSRAEANNAAKSRFLSNMSHELRTPLNAIIGFSQLMTMESNQLTKEQADSLHEISSASEHLLSLINDILDLTKIENGRLTVSLMPQSVNSMIYETLSLVKGVARQRTISLTPPGMTIDYEVKVDRTRMVQIMTNLLTNAIKYNRPGGKVDIRLQHYYDDTLIDLSSSINDPSPTPVLKIIVEDNGIGIPESQQSKVFQTFERLAEDVTIEGTGVGLALCKQLALLMHGRIGFQSKEGFGSQFWIEFPVHKQL